MIKVIFLLKFRKDMAPEDVRRWWLNEHSVLALENRGMRRYVQNHFLGPIDPDHAEAGMEYDGCVEVWFDDREALERTLASPEWKALEDDGPNGFEMTALMGGYVAEHVMRWDADPDRRPYTATTEP